MPNRLAAESSPYLRQHADNPVEWWPWSAEAFAEARRLDKPVFVSIGYAACHWCHVMAHESFEDAETARADERAVRQHQGRSRGAPRCRRDLHERDPGPGRGRRLAAVGVLLARWPAVLPRHLLPDRAAVRPPELSRHARRDVRRLPRASAATPRTTRWRCSTASSGSTRTTGAARCSADPRGAVGVADHRGAGASSPSAAIREFGGLGGAPKFPSCTTHDLLARASRFPHGEPAREAFDRWARGMAEGGIYDHLGGGFARYSVDARWLVPHFEKMLYDQAAAARDLRQRGGDGRCRSRCAPSEVIARDRRASSRASCRIRRAGCGRRSTPTARARRASSTCGRRPSCAPRLGRGQRAGVRATPTASPRPATSSTAPPCCRGSRRGRRPPRRTSSPSCATSCSPSAPAASGRAPTTRCSPAGTAWRSAAWSRRGVPAATRRRSSSRSASAGFVRDRMIDGDQLARVYHRGATQLDGTLDDYAFVAAGLPRSRRGHPRPRPGGSSAHGCSAPIRAKFVDRPRRRGRVLPGAGRRPAAGPSPRVASRRRDPVGRGDRHPGAAPRSAWSPATPVRSRSPRRTWCSGSPATTEGNAWANSGLLAALDLYLHAQDPRCYRRAAGGDRLLNAARRTYAPTLCVAGPWAASSIVDGKTPADDRAHAFVCSGPSCSLPVTDPGALSALLGDPG